MTAVLVAGAGACGVLARYGITQAVGASSALWSVLAIDVVGFTTFSTFSLDVFADLEAGRPGRAVVYVLLSVGLGVGAAAAGWALARA